MRLYEFDGSMDPQGPEESDHNPLEAKLAAIVGQLQARTDDTGAEEPVSIKALIGILRDKDIEVSEEDLKDMVHRPPLSKIISNIQGDDVIFKGQDDEDDFDDSIEEPDTENTLDQMSKRAMKK